MSTFPRTDIHVHSNYSPCGIDVSIEKNIEVAVERGIELIAITDHGTTPRPQWIDSYFRDIATVNPPIILLTGMEVDVNLNGELIVERSIRKRFDILVAALHTRPGLTGEKLYKWWSSTLRKVITSGEVLVIAHPTDIAWYKINPPTEYILEVVDELKDSGVVVELNYHHRDPSNTFLRLCIERGVKITPTSDAHRLDEIGRFNWHRHKIRSLGFKLNDVNWLTPEEILNHIA